MYSGSVTPNSEFWIICGENPKSTPPINDNNGEKNLLQRKYIGMMVPTEIVIDKIRWRSMYPNAESNWNILKNNERNSGHPLFGRV